MRFIYSFAYLFSLFLLIGCGLNLTNVPGTESGSSNVTVLEIGVQPINSFNLQDYQYKIVRGASDLCSASTDWSENQTPNSLIQDDISQIEDGRITVCVRANVSAANPSGEQSINKSWIKDTTPPSPFEISGIQADYPGLSVSLTRQTPNESGLVFAGVLSTTEDCENQVSEVVYSESLSLQLAAPTPGSYWICAGAIDLAGNVTFATGLPYLATFGTPSPTPTPTPSPTPCTRCQYEGDIVFGFVQNRADGPSWNSAIGAWTRSASDTRQTVIWDETFSVPAGTTLTIENKVIEIRPSANITPQSALNVMGTLEIRNSLLLWYSTVHRSPILSVHNGGRLVLENSYSFQGNSFWVNWDFQSGSQIVLNNYVGDAWTTLHGAVNYQATNYSTTKLTLLSDTAGSSVSVLNGHHVWLEVFPPIPSTIEISFPNRKQWANWSLNSIWPSTTVDIVDSYIYERDISLSMGVKATVTNTEGFSMGWILGNTAPNAQPAVCEINDLGDPTSPDLGKYYADHTWDLVGCGLDTSLRLVNSTLVRAWPTFWGKIDLTVRNSNLADTRVLGGGAKYRIYNSRVGILESSGYYDNAANKPMAYIENSIVSHDLDAKYGGLIYYNNVLPLPGGSFRKLEYAGGQIIELPNPGSPF